MGETEDAEQIGAKMKILISQDWLRRKVETDPDLDGDAGDDMMARRPALSGDLAELVERLNKCARAFTNGLPLADAAFEAITAITALSEKLAAAENDAAAWKADAGETHLKLAAAEADRELDAVLALVEAKLPGRRIMIWQCEDGTWAAHLINQTDTEYAPTPALAVAATLLQALEDKP